MGDKGVKRVRPGEMYGQGPNMASGSGDQAYSGPGTMPYAAGQRVAGMSGMDGGSERPFPCVRLRGLPFDATEPDVVQFMGFEPIDLLMVKRDGRFSGEAFLLLSSQMQVELALGKDKGYLGRRYVEVFMAKKQDYYKAIVNEMADGGAARPSQQMGQEMPGGDMRSVYMDPMQGGFNQSGYYEDPNAAWVAGGSGYGVSGGFDAYNQAPAQRASGTTVLKLRGLPFNVRVEEIRDWFEDPQQNVTPVAPLNINLITEFGRPSGIAYIEFATPQEATVAMDKDRQMLGNRYIEVFPSAKGDLERHLAKPGVSSY